MSKRDHPGLFRRGDPRTRELGVLGGKVTAGQRRKKHKPYTGTILDVMDTAKLTGPSWRPWRAFWSAVFALPMDDELRAIYTRHTERETPPAAPVREAWMPIGRRGGKSMNAAVAALTLAIRFDVSRLARGESAIVPILAADRKQARTVLRYLKGLCELAGFRPYVHRMLKESVEFRTGINVEVHTASFKTVRGYTCVGVICDEIAFWSVDDGAANPDSEILTALRPAMATVPDALLLGLSSPYAARGELYRAVERSFGKDDARVLCWNASTDAMNPEIDRGEIERAFDVDPIAAASEYGQDGRVQFRRDVVAFLDPEAVRAVVVPDRRELPPQPGVEYMAFVDPSGGSKDSFTMAIAHVEGERAVLDVVRERRPPFSPDSVVADFAALLRTYRVASVTGDRYGGEWPPERFRAHGITYTPSEKSKSDIYMELLPLVNAERCALLDLPVLRNQLLGLERRTSRGGKDSVDHRLRDSHDDVANAVAGVLTLFELGAHKRILFGTENTARSGTRRTHRAGSYDVTETEDGTAWYVPAPRERG